MATQWLFEALTSAVIYSTSIVIFMAFTLIVTQQLFWVQRQRYLQDYPPNTLLLGFFHPYW
jgi:hypothetical protein